MSSAGAVLAGSAFMTNAACAWLCASLLQQGQAGLARGDRYALAGACAGGVAAMWSAFAAMAGLGLRDVGQVALDILIDTRFGHTYLLAMGALALATLARVLRLPVAVSWGLLLVFALGRAQVSHAGGDGLFSAGMLIDALHLLLGCVWLGSVFVAAWLVMPAAGLAPPLAYMQRLSATAAFALAGIVLSGFYGAWLRLDAPTRLFDHPYGVVLAAKLALFGVAACLGAFNRFIGFPAATRDGGAMARRVLRVESGFLLAAMAAAAVLTQQSPPQ